MAIIRASGILSAISGKLGGQVFVNGRGSAIVRHRPATQGGRSRNHEAAAQRLVKAQRLWAPLSDDNKASWRNFAVQFPVMNRLGQRRPLSGFQAFVRFNVRLQMFNGFTVSAPTSSHLTFVPESISVTASASGDILIDFDPTVAAPFYNPLVYGATLSRGTIPPNYRNWRFLGTFTYDGAVPSSINAFWDPVWPHPVEGQDIAIRADFHTPLLILAGSFTAATITTA